MRELNVKAFLLFRKALSCAAPLSEIKFLPINIKWKFSIKLVMESTRSTLRIVHDSVCNAIWFIINPWITFHDHLPKHKWQEIWIAEFNFAEQTRQQCDSWSRNQVFTSNQHHDDTENFLIKRVCRNVSEPDRRKTAEREVQRRNVRFTLSDVGDGDFEALRQTVDPSCRTICGIWKGMRTWAKLICIRDPSLVDYRSQRGMKPLNIVHLQLKVLRKKFSRNKICAVLMEITENKFRRESSYCMRVVLCYGINRISSYTEKSKN